MTIHSIEQILDRAIALLMYGSSGWLSYSLVVFVVTRSKASVYPDANVSEEMVSKETVSKETASTASEGIISIEVTPESEEPPELEELSEPEKLPGIVPVVQVVETPQIVCQPVNWKKWKVGELRQANITRVCGVRISPIGSSRKLTKADLVAQYEQNLKRLTYEQSELPLQSEKIA